MSKRRLRVVLVVNGLCYIPLNGGKFALCDEADYGLVSLYNWTVSRHDKRFYVHRKVAGSMPRRDVQLHRVILGLMDSNVFVDHRDGNGLNNCRSNLRCASNSQNQMNVGLMVDNSSGYKGVSWHRRDKKWVSQIRVNGVSKHLGYFDFKEDAAKAYDEASLALHGEFYKNVS